MEDKIGKVLAICISAQKGTQKKEIKSAVFIEDYGIENGQFDNVSSCKYKVPTVMDIGRVYQTLIMDVEKSYKNIIEAIKAVYFSFISNEISDFNSSVYYSNPDYLRCSYEAGKLLD